MKIKKVKSNFLVFAGLIIMSSAVFALAEENSSSNKNIFQDSDQDGLSNEEERAYGTNPNNPDTDGDGYSDGIEITSGYNPLKPAPGDKIITAAEPDQKIEIVAGVSSEESASEKENLTNKFSQKISALIEQSQMENKDITMEDIDAIINENISAELTFEDLPEIDEKTIKIKKQNYSKLSEEDRLAKEKDDSLKYLTAVSYIMVSNSPQKISTTEDLTSLSENIVNEVGNFATQSYDLSFFINLAEKGNIMLEQLEDVEVPENLLEIHKRGLQLANYSVSLKDEVKINSEDPIANMAYVSKASSIISLSNSLFSDVTSSLEKYGISEIPLESL